MNLYIKKISFLLLSFAFIFTACETEESLTITTPEAKFVLNTPGISTVFLNFALPDNPAFTISWNDEVTGSSSYNVEMATDEAFTTPVTLGTTDKSNFSMSVADFNNAIANTGVSTFKDIAIYMRVSAGSQISNNILLLVTTYPVNEQVVNSVSDGDAFVLSLDNNDAIAITVEWDDPILDSSLGVDVEYFLEAATAGTNFAMPIEMGSVTNQNSISLTNAQLNAAAIQSGIPVDSTGDLDIRVRSVITDSASGSVLERIGDTITISVTTYLNRFRFIYNLGYCWFCC